MATHRRPLALLGVGLAVLCFLVLPIAQYAAISNAGELYSYLGDDTGAWQRGSFFPWRSLPFRPFIGSVFAVLREPLWPVALWLLRLYVGSDHHRAEVLYTSYLSNESRPRPFDVVFSLVNSSIWLSTAFLASRFLGRYFRRRGLVGPSWPHLVLALAVLVLASSAVHFAVFRAS